MCVLSAAGSDQRCAATSLVGISYVTVQRPCAPPALAQNAIASDQAFCHCSKNCTKKCIGFAADGSAAFGQAPAGRKPDREFSFDNITVGFGDLICSSQASTS